MSELGKYIVIEGGDGTGKSTQAKLVTQRLQDIGLNPLVVPNPDTGELGPPEEPGGTPRANELRKIIKDGSIERTPWQNVMWFTEARQSLWNEAILPALENGQPVVSARSWVSTVAYQGYGEGVSPIEILKITTRMVGNRYIAPDLLCILALHSEAIVKQRKETRGTDTHSDTFESKPEDFQASMKDGYIRFAEETGITPIDASQSRDEVFTEIWAQVEATLNQR